MSDGNAEKSGIVKEPRDYQQQEDSQQKGQREKVMSSESRTWAPLGEENWNQDRRGPRRSGTMQWGWGGGLV